MFLRNGLALHPYPSLTNNTGHDLSGENCKPTQLFHWDQLADEIPVSKIRLEESVRARQLMRNFYRRIHFPAKNSKYHRRKLIPLSFRNAVKLISDPDTRQNHFASVKKESEIQRIKAIPRYIKDQTSLLGFPLTFNDPASFPFMYREIFEKEVYYFPTENTHPFIIDCGSNIGLSLIYFKKIYPEATILGFEPDPEAFQTLQENISQSGVNGVELFNKGIWDCNTTLDFRTEGADGGRVATGTDSRNLVRIETVRLKEILDNKNIDLLKLDIEGAEFRVLLDCREQLHDVKRIFVEYHSFPGEPQELGSILQILKDAGFRYYLSNPGLTSENPFDKVVTDASMDMQFNIYGIRTK